MRKASHSPGEHVPTADQRVVLYNVPWGHYEEQLRLRGDASVPRITYSRGALELMSPSRNHERLKSYIGRLIEGFALHAGIDLSPYGGWTLKSEPGQAGAEPDECYIIGPDQERDRPDLVIEVVWTSGGLDKLGVCLRLGIQEFWQWKSGRIEIHILREGQYVRVDRSELLPSLDAELLARFLDHPTAMQAVKAYRQVLEEGPRLLPPRKRSRKR